MSGKALLALRVDLRLERAAWEEERRQSKRFGANWHHAKGAIKALDFALARLAALQKEMP